MTRDIPHLGDVVKDGIDTSAGVQDGVEIPDIGANSLDIAKVEIQISWALGEAEQFSKIARPPGNECSQRGSPILARIPPQAG